MVSIAPTVTADNNDDYRTQIELISRIATRVHIDLSDGIFAQRKLVGLDDVWWPAGVRADLHMMYQKPFDHIETYLALGPQMVIVHAEAEGDFMAFANKMHKHGIEVGVALLPDSGVTAISQALPYIDHVLVFSGNLGYQGGSTANLNLLKKVRDLRVISKRVEIGWDGGINDENVEALMSGGVEVLNVGGFIQKADDPSHAYQLLADITSRHE
jgi:ribulose-phosphate 3-epimerase